MLELSNEFFTIMGVASALGGSWAITKKTAIMNAQEIQKIKEQFVREDGLPTYVTRDEIEDIQRPRVQADGRAIFVTRPEYDETQARVKILEQLIIGCDGRSVFVTHVDCDRSSAQICRQLEKISEKMDGIEDKNSKRRDEDREVLAGLRTDMQLIKQKVG